MIASLKKELHIKKNSTKIILCIGSKNCMGDSLGPMVGEFLKRNIVDNKIKILGDFNECITCKTIGNFIKKINIKYENPYIITVDSALGKKEYVGKIVITRGKMILGSSLGKRKYEIGNLGIKGIVGENKGIEIENFITLNKVSESLIYSLANNISKQIYEAIFE